MFRSSGERIAAAIALLVCSPLLLIAMLGILAESGWPVLFRQTRAGQYGNPFKIVKLRTMRLGETGSVITKRGDSRITRIGALLRRYKIDELPQLWNILLGHMELIGPRPEVLRYVDMTDPLWLLVLSRKPGLSDPATLIYRDEEQMLARYADADRAYREEILPRKLLLSAQYQQRRNRMTDLKLLLLTVKFSFLPSSFDRERITRVFLKEFA